MRRFNAMTSRNPAPRVLGERSTITATLRGSGRRQIGSPVAMARQRRPGRTSSAIGRGILSRRRRAIMMVAATIAIAIAKSMGERNITGAPSGIEWHYNVTMMKAALSTTILSVRRDGQVALGGD